MGTRETVSYFLKHHLIFIFITNYSIFSLLLSLQAIANDKKDFLEFSTLYKQ